MDRQKILIFGAGGIGACYTWVLNNIADVTAVCRSNYDVVSRQGFKIDSGIFGSVAVKPKVVRDCSEAGRDFDYVIVSSKAFPNNNPSTASLITPAVGPNTKIVLLQNGIDIEHEYAVWFPENTIISACVYVPAAQLSPGFVEMGPLEFLEVGTFPADAPAHAQLSCEHFASLIKAGGATCHVYGDIQLRRWIKLLANAGWNPVCALSNLTDADYLRSSSGSTESVYGLMREVVAIASAVGYGDHPWESAMETQVLRAVQRLNTQGSSPSMLQDRVERRPMELEAILGNPIKIARKHGVATPRLDTVYALAKGLECSYLHK